MTVENSIQLPDECSSDRLANLMADCLDVCGSVAEWAAAQLRGGGHRHSADAEWIAPRPLAPHLPELRADRHGSRIPQLPRALRPRSPAMLGILVHAARILTTPLNPTFHRRIP
jgi:hypothetical protein